MKKKLVLLTSIILLLNSNVYSAEQNRGFMDKLEAGLDKIFGKEIETKSDVKESKKKKKIKTSNSDNQKVSQNCNDIKRGTLDKLEAGLDKIFGNEVETKSDIKSGKKCYSKNNQVKINKKDQIKTFSSSNNISLYTGTFDVIDKEGDDQSSLLGIEHKNPNLFRNTFLGKFSPITGAFMTEDSSLYLYTGIEGEYNLGPVKILPSFAPGYYEKGDGKDLGSVLEFKSELKVGLDIFENSQIGYSYSHISNNEWGDINPGTDNQQITFSKNF